MPIEITMPKLSDTMEEGTILRWLKQVGQYVEKGEVVAEVETDKADMELEANDSGTVAEIRVKEGQGAAVGAVLAILSDAGGATTAESSPKGPPERTATASPSPSGRETKPAVPPPPPKRGQPIVPPRAPTAPSALAVTPTKTPAATEPPSGRQQLSKLRLAVAKQMTAAKRDVPHFYVTTEVDMSEVARMRAALSASAAVPERITFTHFIIRALALTLPRHPRVNASWSDGSITYHSDVNIGVAVAVDDGLIAPVLRNCQRLSLRAIARATADLVERAQAGRATQDGLTGATFTVSNMGMLDIEEFSAVITPPQAAILAVGSIKDRPVVRNGQLTVAKTMRGTLSADHRVLNGVEAGRFLEDLKHLLENPLPLLMAAE